jgi:hypothetical protein
MKTMKISFKAFAATAIAALMTILISCTSREDKVTVSKTEPE